MLDVFGEDYIRTARSKGMPERRVILVHNLRASLTPGVTQFGLDVGVLIGGGGITQKGFGFSGAGWAAGPCPTPGGPPGGTGGVPFAPGGRGGVSAVCP